MDYILGKTYVFYQIFQSKHAKVMPKHVAVTFADIFPTIGAIIPHGVP
jgi:hypothetical protein